MCIYPPILHGLRDLILLRLQGALPARYVRELQAILAFFVMPICELEEHHRVLSMPCQDGGMMQCVHHSLLRKDRRGPPFRALLSCSRRIRELNRQNAAMESGVLVDACRGVLYARVLPISPDPFLKPFFLVWDCSVYGFVVSGFL